ncbi:sigma-54-dependent transcriptional regulator [Perlabentimonas gracilis]|jgi:DNA-binding NtrC family response regulator|uniref:sigma-54-dependent transcriptional regulator n=1 Tax=Perlabentimonas gracilis TaxID=2715279 RepID=UPI00140D3055|nr:sigma-54 dependent transcriptional regulator [Perlabentimonas gracilis]NHB67934.1 sigma-54-dependent Fis family transcriptional regulator [Perlabentimonas gracilis]
MAKGNILIVDDNKNVLLALEMLLAPEYNKVSCISNPNLLLSELQSNSYHLVLLDMNFKAGVNTGNEGLYWLQRIKENHPDISVVLITAYGDVELAVKALKAGATDFVLKPWENQKLLATVKSAIELSLSKMEIEGLKQKEKDLIRSINREDKQIIGSSAAILDVLRTVDKVAQTNTNILITGENGTGKELIARRIHNMSVRSNEIMVTVDMGAVSETLFESELFGHVKGAFTDAHESRTGKFELANRGTLFLDEIANLPLNLQSKLLVALQNREVTRVGANQPNPIDIRLICATNKDMNQLVDNGEFREDLLYRINTIHIEVPPLRRRKDDIMPLAEHFLTKYSEKYGKPSLSITQQAKEKLTDYSWPGNIRELEHTIEKAVIMSESGKLKVHDFFSGSTVSHKADTNVVKLDEMEKKMITLAIEKNAGNIKAAANQLGITRQTLYNKMRKYGINQ